MRGVLETLNGAALICAAALGYLETGWLAVVPAFAVFTFFLAMLGNDRYTLLLLQYAPWALLVRFVR